MRKIQTIEWTTFSGQRQTIALLCSPATSTPLSVYVCLIYPLNAESSNSTPNSLRAISCGMASVPVRGAEMDETHSDLPLQNILKSLALLRPHDSECPLPDATQHESDVDEEQRDLEEEELRLLNCERAYAESVKGVC